MGLAAYGSMQAISYVSSPASCADCHSGFYQNYTTARGSILPSHTNKSVSCFACHSGESIQSRIEAIDTVAKAKILKESTPWLNQLFQANFSFNRSLNATSFASLRANCEKCHPNSELKGEMHANNTQCSLCHFAHTKQQVNFEAIGILTHKNLKCTACHGTEAEVQIPSCTKCHTPHLKEAGWDNAVCLSCHNDAHLPTRKNISFAVDTPKKLCSGCHAGEYKNLTTSGGKHNLLPSCASCHPSHEAKLSCWTCHGQILEDTRKHFPHQSNTCNLCHLRAGRSGPKIQCQTCHDPHNPFNGLPRPATNEQIGEIAKQRLENLTIPASSDTRPRRAEE